MCMAVMAGDPIKDPERFKSLKPSFFLLLALYDITERYYP